MYMYISERVLPRSLDGSDGIVQGSNEIRLGRGRVEERRGEERRGEERRGEERKRKGYLGGDENGGMEWALGIW